MLSILIICILVLNIYNNLSEKMKEIVNYVIVGGCTTLVSILSYYIFRVFIESYMVCTVLSWICAIIFAYITNRIFVFHSKEENVVKEFISFIFSRIVSLLAEIACMYALVDFLGINDRISKIIVQVIIIVLNYILSKIFVFKKNE